MELDSLWKSTVSNSSDSSLHGGKGENKGGKEGREERRKGEKGERKRGEKLLRRRLKVCKFADATANFR